MVMRWTEVTAMRFLSDQAMVSGKDGAPTSTVAWQHESAFWILDLGIGGKERYGRWDPISLSVTSVQFSK
ncbi:hypothetical protein COP2_002443 [Malus domestica]